MWMLISIIINYNHLKGILDMPKYTIGIDYGTQSGRAVMVDVQTGEVVAQNVKMYAHGVMDRELPDGTPLPLDWALEHPADYIDVLETVIPAVVKESCVDPEDIIGIGVDVTSNTFMPMDKDCMPLCLNPEFEKNPHAWLKLWKHHGGQSQANRMTKIALERGEPFIKRYGNKINSEWMWPKLAEIAEAAPEIYEATDCFMEAGDWLVYLLTGEKTRSESVAGYKLNWIKGEGYPSSEYLKAVHPSLEHAVEEKLGGKLLPIGQCAGRLTEEMAEKLISSCPETSEKETAEVKAEVKDEVKPEVHADKTEAAEKKAPSARPDAPEEMPIAKKTAKMVSDSEAFDDFKEFLDDEE